MSSAHCVNAVSDIFGLIGKLVLADNRIKECVESVETWDLNTNIKIPG